MQRSNEMLIVDMFESLDKLLVIQELQLNKTKQINPWSIGIRRTKHYGCICGQKDKNSAPSELVAKRTKNLALHCVSYIPEECRSPYYPEFALGKKVLFWQLYNRGSQHYHTDIYKIASGKSWGIWVADLWWGEKWNISVLSVNTKALVRYKESSELWLFYRLDSSCSWFIFSSFTFRLHWSFRKRQNCNTLFFPQLLVCLV